MPAPALRPEALAQTLALHATNRVAQETQENRPPAAQMCSSRGMADWRLGSCLKPGFRAVVPKGCATPRSFFGYESTVTGEGPVWQSAQSIRLLKADLSSGRRARCSGLGHAAAAAALSERQSNRQATGVLTRALDAVLEMEA